MTHQTKALLEGIMLLILGLGTIWFALSGDYWSLLNPKFRTVTLLTGGFLTLLGLLHALRGHSHRNITAFLLMGIVAGSLWGWNLQALWTPVEEAKADIRLGVEDFFPVGSSRVDIEGKEFIKINVGELYLLHDGTEKGSDPRSWVFQGVVRTSDELAAKNMVAVARPSMVCCLADAIEVGFLVTYDKAETFQDGDWVQVFGTVTDVPPEEQNERPPGTRGTFPLVVQPRFLVLADLMQTTPKPKVPFMFRYADEEPFYY